VEVADSSLSYDLGRKAQIFAALGVRDYWAIDALRMITHIHRLPTGGADYGAPAEIRRFEVATPLLLPDLAVRLSDLGLQPVTA
jgi:Uma2 family endonuclease